MTTAKERYVALEKDRQCFLDRAEQCAEVTLPYLMPPAGMRNQVLPTPWQAMGAKGVNGLASKMLLALMPPSEPFFKFDMADVELDKATGRDPDMRAAIEKGLVRVEQAIMTEIDARADRIAAHEVFKQLIVSGNVATFVPVDKTMRVFKLNQFVTQRDPSGQFLLLIIKEEVSRDTLSDEVKSLISTDLASDDNNARPDDKNVEIYTTVQRQGDLVVYHQEIENEVIPGSEGMAPLDRSPYQVLGWSRIDGEHYARSYCEEYLGDLQSLDGLSQSLVEGSAAMARLVFLRNPMGSTKLDAFKAANNGDIIDGVEGDINAVQVAKFADFNVTQQTKNDLEQRISQAFLMQSSVTRNAERVTAEEIRFMATELEESLGGVYSVLSQEFQLPYLKRRVAAMTAQGRLPQLPKNLVTPTIIGGLDALGRSHEMNKAIMFARASSELLGPQAVVSELNAARTMEFVGTQTGFDVSSLLNTAEEKQAISQQARQRETMQALGPQMMRQANQTQG